MSKSERQRLLAELDFALSRLIAGDDETLTESALRDACAAVVLATYPDASGAEHEMDVRRLLRAVVEAYAQSNGAPGATGQPMACGEAVFDAHRLCDAVCRLGNELR